MRLADVLRPELVLPALHSTKKEDAIRIVSARLAEAEGIEKAEIVRALTDREVQGTTAIGEGVAVPHGKIAAATRMAACLARSRTGVAFGAADGLPVHFIFALISPEDAAGNHLKILARFSYLFKDSSFRDRLMAAGSRDEIFQLIDDKDSR